MRIDRINPTLTVGFRCENPNRQIPYIRCIVLDSQYFLFTEHLQMGVKSRNLINASLELADVRSIVKSGRQVTAVGSLRGKQHFAWHPEQLAHSGKIVA